MRVVSSHPKMQVYARANWNMSAETIRMNEKKVFDRVNTERSISLSSQECKLIFVRSGLF